MRNILILVAGVIHFLCFSGCSIGGQAPAQVITIDFQGYFKDSFVVVYADNVNVFEGMLTSNAVLGYTGKSIKVLARGKLDLKIKMKNFELNQKVYVRRGTYIGVLFNSVEQKFSLIQAQYPFQYD